MTVIDQVAGWSNWLPAIATITAAIIAAWVALRMHRTTILVQTVTAERAKWRSELREKCAALSTQIHLLVRGQEADIAVFCEARIGILLRLNPMGRSQSAADRAKHPLDEKIHRYLDYLERIPELSREVVSVPPTRQCIMTNLLQFERAVQELIKQEWDKSKREAGLTNHPKD